MILAKRLFINYIKPKYGDRAKQCFTDTDSVIIHIITEDCFVDILDDGERWFDTSNYDENEKRPLSIGKNKNVIVLFKDELGEKSIKEFCALRAKTYSYLIDDNSEDKKSKGTKLCQNEIMAVRELFVKKYLDCPFYGKIVLKQ